MDGTPRLLPTSPSSFSFLHSADVCYRDLRFRTPNGPTPLPSPQNISYVGRCLCRMLVQCGAKTVRSLDVKSPRRDDRVSGVEYYEGDVRDPEVLAWAARVRCLRGKRREPCAKDA